jgi:hypothetical protein
VGRGGGDVEAAGRVRFALLPLADGAARRLAQRALGRRGGDGGDGAAGAHELSVDAVAATIEGIGRWWDAGHDWPDLAEVDINPIAVTADGPLILDALAVRAGRGA